MATLTKNEWNAFLKRAQNYAKTRTNNAINKQQKANAARIKANIRNWAAWGRRHGLNK